MPAASDEQLPSLNSIIAANVRAERARRKWSQDELADRLGWRPNMVSTIEIGRRAVHADDLIPLCRAFGISLAVLMRGLDDDSREVLGIKATRN